MSAAEGLKAAVRQRLEGVLVEVLGLIQTTMEQYESELKQRREEVERLRGPRTLRLRTEMTELTRESENEQNEIYILTSIKEEQPEQRLSGPTATKSFPHNQNHENPTSNHNLKSEDSDEECPICRRLDQERNDSALINVEDGQTVSIQPQETEKTAVKSEEEERGLSDTNKPHQDLNEQDKREEGRLLPTTSQDKIVSNSRTSSTNSGKTGGSSFEKDLVMDEANINATTQKDPKDSDRQKEDGPAEKGLSSLEGKSSQSDDGLVGAKKMDETCGDQERRKEGIHSQKAVKRKATDQDQEIASKSRKDCSKFVECEKVATEKEYQKEANFVVHSSLSNSAEKGLSTREGNGKSRSLDPKSHGSKSLDVEDRVQDMVRNLPTVRLIPLEFLNKTQRSKVQLTKQDKTKFSQKQNGVQNSESSQKSKTAKMTDKSKTVAGRSSEFLKSPTQSSSPKKSAQKEHGKKSSDDLLRKAQKLKKKALNAEQSRVGLVNSSVANNSQHKMNKSRESGKSKVDGVSQTKNATTQMPTVVQSSPVTEEHKAKSLKLNSNRGTNSPLEKTGKEIDSSRNAGETSQNVSDRGASETNGTVKDLAKSVKKKHLKSKAEHECTQCGTMFLLKGNLLKHLVMHQEERPFACSLCDSRFKRKMTLKEHMSIHSDEKQFKCSVCPRTYTRKSNLSDHMKTHLEQARPFSCSMCSRSFTCRSNLRRHIVAHSGLRPFRCDICGKSFGRKSILQDHITMHTREKHFKCLICNIKFTTKTIQQRHMRVHDNKRKFRCTVCTAAFNQNGHLRQHMLRHTGEKPYSCSVCEKTFTRKAYVQKHSQKYCHKPAHPEHHSDKQEPEAAH